jgi:protein-disulfide isomerase/uncharacterized membrane protein
MKQPRVANPLPYNFYLWIAVLITLIGIAGSVYLAISHYRVYTDIEYKSFCAISKAINCDTVSQSPHAIFLNMPVAVWGILAYAVIFILVTFAGSKSADNERIWSLIFWAALFYSLYSVLLALISTYVIGSYCIMCIVTYGVNFALLFYAWLVRRRFAHAGLFEDTRKDILFLWENKARRVLLLAVFFAAALSTWAFFPNYWKFQRPLISEDIPKGFTQEGHPWIGAPDPVLEITEFTDYQCFQCRKMHFYLRQLVVKNPDKIRIIHRHYPMDHEFNPIVKDPFHVGSGKLALLAAYAAYKNKFWQMNDLLYEIGSQKKPVGTRELAGIVNLDHNELALAINDRAIRHLVKHDIYTGNKLGIVGTPAYVIGDRVFQGHIPPGIIRRMIN